MLYDSLAIMLFWSHLSVDRIHNTKLQSYSAFTWHQWVETFSLGRRKTALFFQWIILSYP